MTGSIYFAIENAGLKDQLAASRQEIELLREALKPFADDTRELVPADFRRAAAALADAAPGSEAQIRNFALGNLNGSKDRVTQEEFDKALEDAAPGAKPDTIEAYLQRQAQWSERTFGSGSRTLGIVDHIRKELNEVLAAPHDLEEWIDVTTLAMDGFWRHGGDPRTILDHLSQEFLAQMERSARREGGRARSRRCKPLLRSPQAFRSRKRWTRLISLLIYAVWL